jgi:type IV pilus assembly protein PilC
MSPLAINLMQFGGWLGDTAVVIALIIAAIIVVVVISWAVPAIRRGLGKAFSDTWGSRGIFGKIASSRFVFAMRLAMASGLDTSESINIASTVSGGSKAVDGSAGILSLHDSKMLAVGSASGKADIAMAEIARRSDIDVRENVDRIIGRIEPTLVVLSSAAIGVILLSVMLPLMSIMTAIG